MLLSLIRQDQLRFAYTDIGQCKWQQVYVRLLVSTSKYLFLHRNPKSSIYSRYHMNARKGIFWTKR